jgi:hypothetical protein
MFLLNKKERPQIRYLRSFLSILCIKRAAYYAANFCKRAES